MTHFYGGQATSGLLVVVLRVAVLLLMPGADIQHVALVYFGISALAIIFITLLFIFVVLRDPIVIEKLK